MSTNTVRVRFAPSPTGHLHIGGLRTAIFNWLFARNCAGVFLVRIEDTDQERSHPAYVDSIVQSLTWAKLISDEPLVFQTQRFDMYSSVAQNLIAQGKAYRCYCPASKDNVGNDYLKYDGRCRERNVTDDDSSKPHVIRFKFPLDNDYVTFQDMIHGTISFPLEQFDDFILIRTDGVPVYNFVVVVDDIAMRITHVIRGEDHISNTPKQIKLYQALDSVIPQFAHLPLILGPSGQPLSKREAATAVQDYIQKGYLADALVNYLVRLGWSHGDQEIFSRQQMIEFFSLHNVGKSGAIFDQAKLDWLNSVYMKQTSSTDLLAYIVRDVVPSFMEQINTLTEKNIVAWIDLYKDRTKTLLELAQEICKIFQGRYQYTHDVLTGFDDHDRVLLSDVKGVLEQIDHFSPDACAHAVKSWCKQNNVPLSAIAKPLRLALIGTVDGPSLFATLALLGRQEVVQRIEVFMQLINR